MRVLFALTLVLGGLLVGCKGGDSTDSSASSTATTGTTGTTGTPGAAPKPGGSKDFKVTGP